MNTKTSIEWTETTWNPVTGCTKISPGCKNCYAERMAKRLHAMGQFRYRNGFNLTLQPQTINEPYKWKKSRIIFVNSMSDLFHELVPLSFISEVFHVMNDCKQHQFQILTKRLKNLRQLAPFLTWTENIWIGVSIESQEYVYRIDDLRAVPANIRFLSIEPFISPITRLDLTGIDWVIVGGESGPYARPMLKKWVRKIKEICIEQNVPFFFKQWGGVRKNKRGRLLDEREWNEMPLRINTNQCFDKA
jgi:protein gp37